MQVLMDFVWFKHYCVSAPSQQEFGLMSTLPPTEYSCLTQSSLGQFSEVGGYREAYVVQINITSCYLENNRLYWRFTIKRKISILFFHAEIDKRIIKTYKPSYSN